MAHQIHRKMRDHLRNEDFLCGVALVAFAVFVLVAARSYPVGTANNMGPGYFPIWLSYILMALGLVLAASAVRQKDAPEPTEDKLELRPLLLVAVSYVGFGVTLSSIGLLPAVALVVVVSSYAIPKRQISEVAVIIVAMEAMTIALWKLVQISVPLVGGS